MGYVIRDREAGNTIERCATREEAIKKVTEYEHEDLRNGNYTKDFYEIVLMGKEQTND